MRGWLLILVVSGVLFTFRAIYMKIPMRHAVLIPRVIKLQDYVSYPPFHSSSLAHLTPPL